MLLLDTWSITGQNAVMQCILMHEMQYGMLIIHFYMYTVVFILLQEDL
jgi:hypothetical protein